MSRKRWSRVVFRVAGLAWVLLFLAGAGTLDTLAEFALIGPARDSTLIENPSGALGNGSGPAIFAGRISSSSGSIRRALLSFDVAAAIPPGSTVTRATLRLNLSATNAGPVLVQMHRVLADWGEGGSVSSGGAGAPSLPGDSTWIHRFYDDVFWTNPGGDFDPVPRAATLVDQPGGYSWGSTPEMVEDVQSWLDHAATSYGWLLAGDESQPTTVKRFDSRESPFEADRPLLGVEYVPPCAPNPVGPGYWKQQCLALEGGDAIDGSSRVLDVREPRFADWVLPCANKTLAELGLPEIDACEAILLDQPRDCRERAVGKLAVLVLNVCAGRLQTSCPVTTDGDDCAATSVGDLLPVISLLIRDGDCRQASGCAALPD